MPNTKQKATRSEVLLLLAVCLVQVAGFTGCGEPDDPPPKTYEVTGKVVYDDGSPLQGGTIEFYSEDNSGLTVMGEIQDDGKFRLTTMTGKEKLSGAVEGTYTVTITTGLSQDQTEQQAFDSIDVPNKYAVKTSDNHFTITVPRR